jgi:hypothetical protein
MGHDKVRYLMPVKGSWYWRATKSMREAGFATRALGKDYDRAKAEAIRFNEEWDRYRRGGEEAPKGPYFPPGTLGHAYVRVMNMRAQARKAKSIEWTAEQASRDDWPRAWRWLGHAFAVMPPLDITPEQMMTLRNRVLEKVSETEAHRMVKVFRALWKKLPSLGAHYAGVTKENDPSLLFANNAPQPRQAVWSHREVVIHVQRAWRLGFKGLAACLAVGWDTMLSPIDARTLSLEQMVGDDNGAMFFLDRAKTGRAAAGTMTRWSEALLRVYVAELEQRGIKLLPSDQIFHTPGTEPGPRGGRRWQPQPYTKDTLAKDFRLVRVAINPAEERTIADMRRSGAVEADAGGATDTDLSNKMANTISASTRLRKTYNPVNVPSVRRVDEARGRGRELLGTNAESQRVKGEQNPTKSANSPRKKVQTKR